jgi:hypothetical protein
VPARRIAWVGLLAVIGSLAIPAAGGGVPPPPGALPETVVTFDRGRVHGTPWRLIAYRTDGGLWCQALVRRQTVSSCTGTRPEPNPLLITAAFHRRGQKPTTFAVISTTDEIARVALKLVPGDIPLSRRVRALPERERMQVALPRGYRYATIAIDRVKGLRSIDAFDAAGQLVGHNDGISPPAR